MRKILFILCCVAGFLSCVNNGNTNSNAVYTSDTPSSISRENDSIRKAKEDSIKEAEYRERTKRLDPAWYRTKEGEAERLAAKTGNYVYPEKIMVKYKGLMYGFGKGMSTGDVMMKMGNPDDYSRTDKVLIWYYDNATVQFYFINGELDSIVELGSK
ncbi:MAG: hypothetical protein II826_10895 [Prevotella sp.]|nr:hypothetical protein [Prevotella sp.]